MYNYGNPGRGIDRSFPESSSGSSGSSSASVATTTGTTQQQQQKYSVAGSGQFVPSLNAITSNQSLQWMLQPSIGTPGPSRALRSSYPLPPGIPATMNPPQPSQSHLSRPGVIRAAAAIGSTTRRNDEYLSPEELERRRIRRERNKMAAAKCRNRRRELTDTLQNETDQLEDEKSRLQKEIADLQKEKEKLELVFEAHRPICKVQESESDSDSSNDIPSLSGIKIEPVDPDLPGPSRETKHYAKINKPKPKITIPPPPSASSITGIPLESESLHTPVLISTPSLTPFTASLVFSYPSTSLDTSSQALNLVTSHPSSQNPQPCAVAHRRSSSSGDQSDHSLNSPTILTL